VKKWTKSMWLSFNAILPIEDVVDLPVQMLSIIEKLISRSMIEKQGIYPLHAEGAVGKGLVQN
jgi:hypothetical protein